MVQKRYKMYDMIRREENIELLKLLAGCEMRAREVPQSRKVGRPCGVARATEVGNNTPAQMQQVQAPPEAHHANCATRNS